MVVSKDKIKNIIIGIMAVTIMVLTWLLFRADAGRYCQPAGFGKSPAPPVEAVPPDTAAK